MENREGKDSQQKKVKDKEKEQQKTISKLESLLQKVIKEGNVNVIHIDKLEVQGPFVDKLDVPGPLLDKVDLFTFDKIDVKEVSGALNLGNNLGVSVHDEEKNKPPSKKEKGSASKQGQGEKTDAKKKEEKYKAIKKKVDEKLQEILGGGGDQQTEEHAKSVEAPLPRKRGNILVDVDGKKREYHISSDTKGHFDNK